MRINFDDNSYVEFSYSATPGKLAIVIAAASSPTKKVINTAEITPDELKQLLADVNVEMPENTVKKTVKKTAKKKAKKKTSKTTGKKKVESADSKPSEEKEGQDIPKKFHKWEDIKRSRNKQEKKNED